LPQFVVDQIVSRRGQQPYTGLKQVLSLPGISSAAAAQIANRFTTTNQPNLTGRINVNTASAQILEALPGMSVDLAKAVVDQQSTGITSLGQLLSIPGMTVSAFAQFVDLVSVNSNTFLVRVIGRSGDLTYTTEALLRTDGAAPVYVWQAEPPYDNMDVRWNWNEVSTIQRLGDES
jgi:type II secretory pathway component PulK